jgi:cephalosporin-C deacetylase-like acetyl esterase
MLQDFRAPQILQNLKSSAARTIRDAAGTSGDTGMRLEKWFVRAMLMLALAAPLVAQNLNNLDFLTGLSDYGHLQTMLQDYLNKEAIARLEERRQQIARLSTPEEVSMRRAYLREQMIRVLGGFPAKTPLNARVVGTLDREGYKIEKVIFESQPHFYVTGNLYLPTNGRPPFPGVLFPLGHEAGGKSNGDWQQTLADFVRRGFVCFTWDPIGQGERVQLYDPDLEGGKVGESTSEHTVAGIQCLLVGDNLARYTIWDGIRALDYLLSRPEVDASRIACTGNSGGGTHTAYLSALDDRIKVAMPSCYITSWRRLLESLGPQDAEQCLPPWIGQRLDHGDFVLAFAPKPFLILSGIRDFFPINGARETYQEEQHVYSVMGAPDKLRQFEADNGHGYLQPRRVAAYQWLSQWLKGQADNSPEEPAAFASEEDLRCTETGQVTVSPGGETVFSLNRKRYAELKPHWPPLNGRDAVAAFREKIRSSVKNSAGERQAASALNEKTFGVIQREGYRIEKLTYESEPGIIIPSLLLIPAEREGRKAAVLYVNSKGKANSGGDIESLVKNGLVVLAIDARGWGETNATDSDESRVWNSFFPNYRAAMTALLLGKSLVAMRGQDIARGLDLLAQQPEVDAERIFGMGVGAGTVPILHQAVLDARLKKVVLDGGLDSYDSVETSRIQRGIIENVILGVMKDYDLPELVAALAPRPTWLVDVSDPLGHRVGIPKVREEYAIAAEAFKAEGVPDALQVETSEPHEAFEAIYRGLK